MGIGRRDNYTIGPKTLPEAQGLPHLPNELEAFSTKVLRPMPLSAPFLIPLDSRNPLQLRCIRWLQCPPQRD